MADEAHLKMLKEQGVRGWNDWRKANPTIQPDLTSAHFFGSKLSTADFRGVNFWGASLQASDLSSADFRGADLQTGKAPCCSGRWREFR